MQEKPNAIFAEAQRVLTATRANEYLYRALATLPLTVVHGDVHPGNMLVTPAGEATLIDWGTACLAPAMREYALAHALGFTMAELRAITRHAVEMAFISPESRVRLLQQLA